MRTQNSSFPFCELISKIYFWQWRFKTRFKSLMYYLNVSCLTQLDSLQFEANSLKQINNVRGYQFIWYACFFFLALELKQFTPFTRKWIDQLPPYLSPDLLMFRSFFSRCLSWSLFIWVSLIRLLIRHESNHRWQGNNPL